MIFEGRLTRYLNETYVKPLATFTVGLWSMALIKRETMDSITFTPLVIFVVHNIRLLSMALNLPVFYQRTGSAVVFAIIMLAGLLWNDLSFFIIIAAINALCLRDYFRLLRKITPGLHWPAWLPISIQLITCLCLCALYADHFNLLKAPVIPLLALLPFVVFIVSGLSRKTALKASLQALSGPGYITLAMLFLLSMRFKDQYLPITLIAMIWSNDTLAYLVGSFIGKTPFSPISPKKTWEGTLGGALLTMAAAIGCGLWIHHFELIDWVAIAFCATFFGTLGDLLESKLKRMAEVKDSGRLMPGHGGALDRFDSLLVAAPFAATYALYFMH